MKHAEPPRVEMVSEGQPLYWEKSSLFEKSILVESKNVEEKAHDVQVSKCV